MADVAMPRLSDSMEEGTILKWLKSDGDEVKRGEELVEIETDKANMTYEADSDGTLTIVAKEGDTLPVGDTIARLGDGSEAPARGARRRTPTRTRSPRRRSRTAEEEPEADTAGDGKREEAPEPAPAQAEAPSGNGGGDRIKASPVAKRMAREMGVELGELKGSGPGGRIVKADVEAAAKGGAATAEAEAPPQQEAPPKEEERPPPPRAEEAPKRTSPRRHLRRQEAGRGETTEQDLTRLQRTVARRMAESKATAPDFVAHRRGRHGGGRRAAQAAQGRRRRRSRPPRSTTSSIKASALALRDFPRANGAYRDGKFELYSRVNVGVAVAGQDALVVPTVFDADSKSLGHDRPRVARARRARPRRQRSRRPSSPAARSRSPTSACSASALRRRDQPAAGGDPRRRRARAAPGRARRRGRGPRD